LHPVDLLLRVLTELAVQSPFTRQIGTGLFAFLAAYADAGDRYEAADQDDGALHEAPAEHAVEWATLLSGWSKSLTYLTNGGPRPTADQLKWLKDHRVAVREEKIAGLDGKEGKLTGVTFDGGQPLGVRAVFVLPESVQRSDLPKKLGCKVLTEGRQAGTIETDAFGATSVPGLYVIGDASSAGMQTVPGAVSDGSMVGVAVQRALVKEDVERV